MKKTTVCLLLIAALLFCTACDKKLRHTVDLPATRPEDFAICFDCGSGEFFDTYTATVGRDRIAAEDVQTALAVSDETMDEIYAKLVECDIASIDFEMNSENCAGVGQGNYSMTPCKNYHIRFRVAGEEYSVHGDETANGYPVAEGFITFVEFMEELMHATPEYKILPEAVGGYC